MLSSLKNVSNARGIQAFMGEYCADDTRIAAAMEIVRPFFIKYEQRPVYDRGDEALAADIGTLVELLGCGEVVHVDFKPAAKTAGDLSPKIDETLGESLGHRVYAKHVKYLLDRLDKSGYEALVQGTSKLYREVALSANDQNLDARSQRSGLITYALQMIILGTIYRYDDTVALGGLLLEMSHRATIWGNVVGSKTVWRVYV